MISESLWRAARPANWRNQITHSKGKSPVPDHTGGQMAKSKYRFHNGLTNRGGCRGPDYDCGGLCHQDGALDPM